MDLAITKMSSKGQVVIPIELRQGFNVGEKIVVMAENGILVLKKANDVGKKLVEDLAFAKRTEEAWQQYKKGKFKSMPAKEFLKELKKW